MFPTSRVIDNYLQGAFIDGVPDLANADFGQVFFSPFDEMVDHEAYAFFDRCDYDLRHREQQFSRNFQEELIIDYDWRYSNFALDTIARRIEDRERILYMGAPMPFFFLGHRTGNWGALVDKNTLYRESHAHKGTVFSEDVYRHYQAADENQHKYDAVIADPPWSMSEIANWARIAATMLSPSGSLLISLFPPNVRPGAPDEIEKVYSILSSMFESVSYTILAYNTPSFEKEIFRRREIPYMDNWRRGFLLFLERARNIGPRIPHSYSGIDSRVWVRSNQSKMSVAALEGSEAPLTTKQFFDSTSSRDPRWKRIRGINSRNWAYIDEL